MNLNTSNWVFSKIGISMDGGSITLELFDHNQKTLKIHLIQSTILEYTPELSKIPGRIYINDTLIEKRSNSEKIIVKYLKGLLPSLENGSDLLTARIEFIESQAYDHLLPIAKQLSEERKSFLKKHT